MQSQGEAANPASARDHATRRGGVKRSRRGCDNSPLSSECLPLRVHGLNGPVSYEYVLRVMLRRGRDLFASFDPCSHVVSDLHGTSRHRQLTRSGLRGEPSIWVDNALAAYSRMGPFLESRLFGTDVLPEGDRQGAGYGRGQARSFSCRQWESQEPPSAAPGSSLNEGSGRQFRIRPCMEEEEAPRFIAGG